MANTRQQLQLGSPEARMDLVAAARARFTKGSLPQEIEMSRDQETVTLHPSRQVTYQKKHRLHIQDLPLSEKKRQASILNKALKAGATKSDDPVVKIALEVLETNQAGLQSILQKIDAEKQAAFCQTISFCRPNSALGCVNLYLGGAECAGIPWLIIGYYKCCVQKARSSKTLHYAEVDEIELPKLYLVESSVLRSADFDSLPSFEHLKQRDMLSVFNFDRCPEFTFVSHKWSGNSPDDAGNSLFREITSNISGYVWVDYMCVPQAGDFAVRLPFLKSIPYVIIASSQVWTPMKTNDYRRSVWCNMEQFLEKDEALALVEEFRIQKAEDLAPIILGLKEVLQLLLIHSTEYQSLVGKFPVEYGAQNVMNAFCNPTVCGGSQFLWFDRPEMHMLNPTLSRICEYYLIHKFSL